MPDKVVITRPRAQAEGLAQAVAALGRTPVLLPLLEIAPLADQSALRAVLAGLDNYALVAFVSPNAIDAALAHLQERLAAWPRQVALAVLGEGSRAALARHGLTEANATIVGPQDPTRSDSENELMAEGFRAAGAEVDVVPVYRRSVPALTPELASTLRGLLLEPNDWLLTSSEALRGLFDLLALVDPSLVAKMQQQHVIVPHARIAETAAALGLAHVTLTGSGDERLLAALQSRT
jgi:uroporphyrinogen-III synthase